MIWGFLVELLVELGWAATPKRAQIGCLLVSIALLILVIGLVWWSNS